MGEQTDQNLSLNGQLPTTVIVRRLAQLLIGYPADKYRYIIDGFTKGFSIGFEDKRGPPTCNNF